MEKRTAESPMDFEWQTKAPGDVTSPFYQLSMQHDNQKKRSHNVFESPGKKPMPALREPNNQPFLFSHTKQAPGTPKSAFAQPAFMTPRKFDLDFSSGAENLSSPELADNDDTPEQPTKSGHRNSLFGMYGRFAPSPGRGEIPRLNHYSHAAARRVQKRRLRNKALDIQLHRDSDDESDRPSSSEGKQKTKKGQEGEKPARTSTFSDFFALLEAHPNVPNILSWWAQLFVNLSLFSLAAYVVYGFVSAIRTEFDQAAEEASDTILAEMAKCAQNYVDNRCGGGDRLPALETVCENWDRCMNRDPAKVGRAKVSAQTMAIIINSFIDPISWKAIAFFLATISTVGVVSNWSFRSFRSRYNQDDYAHAAPTYNRQPSAQHHQFPPQLTGQHSGFGYTGPQHQSDTSGYEKQDMPLLLEQPQTVNFTERSRERSRNPRTPSPVKRGRNLL
ncbi:Di-sulfide bridge nucleocytoplasmic transport domain-containing protein [Aspergillus karnatakaensis]|uniref:putative nuclear envelope protein Brr6 n=1 Tax=Aspergillus karnatakaensis TaxID=1810916 RepID=UPI003CCCF844